MSHDINQRAEKLLKYLCGLKDNRGAMADLRCALTDARRARAWPWLAAVGGIENYVIETVAGLFAYHHPEETAEGNVGTTCRRLSAEHATFDARFRRLLACEREELGEHLRPIILAAKAKDIQVNYKQLFIDLTCWSEHVKARWAKEYWGVPESADQPVVEDVVS